jgi:Flp pilus assembly protein TadD
VTSPDATGPTVVGRPALSLIARVAAYAVPLEIAIVTAAVFLPALRADWTDWDDPINFLGNPYYRGLGLRQLRWMLTASVMGHWIPVTWLTLGADYAVWGMRPFGYHLTSILVHAASAAVFYLVARRLLGLAMPSGSPVARGLGAAAATLFFSLHPLRAESVAWITERRDLTSGFFFLLTILAYLKAHESRSAVRRGWQLASIGFAALALASKSIVMGLPVALLILDVYPLRRLGPAPRDWLRARAWSVWREKIPFGLMAAAVAITAYTVQHTSGYLTDAAPPARVVMVLHNVWFHAWKTLVPLGLGPLYELPVRVTLMDPPYLHSAIGAVAVTLAVWLLRARWPAGLAIWTFYLVMLAPVVGVVHTGNHLGADRNTYVPCMSFALLIGAAVVAAMGARSRGRVGARVAIVMPVLVGLWLAGLAVGARAQTSFWHDPERLWSRGVAVDPNCAICLHNLAIIRQRQGAQETSLALFERALALRPDRSEFHGNYGLLLLQMGRREEGKAELRLRVSQAPGDFSARTNLAIAEIEDGHVGDAIIQLNEALRIRPDSVPALDALGRALLADKRPDAAMVAFQRALEVNPADSVGRLGLARVYLARGDRAGAREQLELLRARDPNLAARFEHEFR